MHTCKCCGEKIEGPEVQVGRRNGSDLETHHLHMTCFEQKYDEFKEWKAQLPEGMTIRKEEPEENVAVAERPKSKDELLDEYKHQAMRYVTLAQEEKTQDIWLQLVNDPGCYYAVRQLISLRGADMTVELFEELAAIYVVLIKQAQMKHISKNKGNENQR